MERDRIGHRITRFRWENGLLFRLWSDGTRRIVPRPDQRASLVRQVHEELGHFGIRRTHSMLRGQYWWTGMYQQVAAYVGRCEVCDRVRSSFNTLSPQLQPLPIMGWATAGHWTLQDHWWSQHVEQNTCRLWWSISASGLSLSLYPRTLQSWPRQPF